MESPISGSDADAWDEWPTCPECGARQQTECSYCGSAGSDFRLADIDDGIHQNGERGRRILLACRDCDDLFQPKFYRLCAHCGHDFGSGIAIPPGSTSDDSRRTWALLVGMGLFAAIVCGYFYWLLR